MILVIGRGPAVLAAEKREAEVLPGVLEVSRAHPHFVASFA